MMNFLRIATYFIVTIIPLGVLILNWKFSDKRKNIYHNITRTIIFIWFFAGIGVACFTKSDLKQKEELNNNINTLSSRCNKLITQNQELTQKVDDLMIDARKDNDEKRELREVNAKLEEEKVILEKQLEISRSLSKDVEEWTSSLSDSKGIAAKKKELEDTMKEREATLIANELNPKFESSVDIFIIHFENIVKKLNEKNQFDGEITYTTPNRPEKIAIPIQECIPFSLKAHRKDPNATHLKCGSYNFINVTFPNKSKMQIQFNPSVISGDKDESLKWPYITMIGMILEIRSDGVYFIRPKKPNWPEGKEGGSELLDEVIMLFFKHAMDWYRDSDGSQQ